MDPIAVDVPKPTNPLLGLGNRPAAPATAKPEPKTEPAKPPFTSPSTVAPPTEDVWLAAKIAALFGFAPTRRNGLVLTAAVCSLVAGFAAVKWLAPKPTAKEGTQPLVAEAKKDEPRKEDPKKEEPKPALPVPSLTETRTPETPLPALPVIAPPAAPVVPPAAPSTTVILPTIPSTPVAPPAAPSSSVIPPKLPAVPPVVPPSGADGFIPAGSSKTAPPSEPIIPPALPVIVPASGQEPPKPAVPPAVPPTTPSVPPVVPPTTPSVPAVPPTTPSVPTVPPTAPELPAVPPSVPPSTPSTTIPPAALPTVPPTTPSTPSAAIPPAMLPTVPTSTPSGTLPPAMLPTVPPSTPSIEPKPMTIEYTKPIGTPDVKPSVPERAPVTSFDVDLHDPKAGETYASISKDFYNDAKYAAALQEYNARRPIQGGFKVEVPPIHVLKKRYPQLIGSVVPAGGSARPTDPWGPSTESTPAFRPTGPRTFTVPTGGMTMGAIARDTLGSPTRWREIYDINPQLSPGDVLPAGTVVKIPETKPNN